MIHCTTFLLNLANNYAILQKRKYFDSGDFALAQAHGSSNDGEVETGSQHPLRQGIPHPYSAVPSSSNVQSNSQTKEQCDKDAGLVRSGSQLHQELSGQAVDEAGGSKSKII